jgi:hypothetical protein
MRTYCGGPIKYSQFQLFQAFRIALSKGHTKVNSPLSLSYLKIEAGTAIQML